MRRGISIMLFVRLLAISLFMSLGSNVFAASQFVGAPPNDSTRKPRLLVFIHGLGNNGISGTFWQTDNILAAWKREGDHPAWPSLFKDDGSVATNFDVFLVQY